MASSTELLSFLFSRLSGVGRTIGGGGERTEQRDTERAQAIVRLIVPLVAAIYLAIGIATDAVTEPTGLLLLVYFGLFSCASAMLFRVITRKPGVHHRRRAFAMFLDFGSITLVMIAGSAYCAPFYGLLIWVTVGYGMRYGSRYLGIATLLALVSLTFIVAFSDYWRGQPYIAAALFVTAVIVPLYAHILLQGTRDAYQAAAAANLAKSRFLAQASHDLRQPVHAIGLFTACLRDAGLDGEQRQMVENIDLSLHSVARLFRSLLDVATLDSGKVSPKIEHVELGPLLVGIAEQNAALAQWANVTLRMVPTRICVRTDPNLVTAMVQNLVSNAIKYAANGPVVVGCRRRGRTVSIVVQDAGQGIPEQDCGRVFDEFYRTSVPGRDVEGVGLGLSIVRRMAKLMGLTVELTSRLGVGTRVSINGLPMTPRTVTPQASARTQPVTPLDGMRIMLIEDDVDVLSATRTLLEKWGCKVCAGHGVPKKIEACDLVLADFDLGNGPSGADCIVRIRQVLGEDVPAIIMTGHDDASVRADARIASIPVLPKPVRPAELRACLLAQRLRRNDAPAPTVQS